MHGIVAKTLVLAHGPGHRWIDSDIAMCCT
jgi:hypothetical protein